MDDRICYETVYILWGELSANNKPSRHLDACLAYYMRSHEREDFHGQTFRHAFACCVCRKLIDAPPFSWNDWGVPRYTGSYDAALNLAAAVGIADLSVTLPDVSPREICKTIISAWLDSNRHKKNGGAHE